MLDDLGLVGDWKDLLDHARDELSSRHPDMNIQINYMESQYNQTRNLLLTALANQAPIDLISLDQIWLGEFAQKGLLTDLTTRAQSWEDPLIGMRRIGRVVIMKEEYTGFGLGLM